MSIHIDPTETLRAMIDALGLSPAQLADVVDTLGTGSSVPTVRDYLPQVQDACPAPSRATYGTHFRRLAETHGDKRLDQVTTADLNSQRDQIILTAGTKKVTKAIEKGRALHSYETDAHGRSAGESFVRATRFFFRLAVDAELIRTNPAAAVKVPARLPNRRRPLLAHELDEVAVAWCTTGHDPELDCLLFEFHRKTAARREGGLNLCLGNLNASRGAVWLTEKFGKTREQPLDVDFIERLDAFARSRGASNPADKVFRSAAGRPITRKYYERLYQRLDEHIAWSEALDLGVHWIRHTTLDDVRVVADSRVAASYAGHSDTSGDTINQYNKVTFEERAAAYETIFGPRFGAVPGGR